ncbi:MAG: SDR family oxidoreductase [Fuerstiella sp.]
MTLKGKVAVVTGASAGIGREIAGRLAQEQACLVLAARSEDRLQQVAAQLLSDGCRVMTVRTDVTDPNDLSQLTDRAVAEFGRIDILINNAGVECFDYFERLDTDDILQTIETNLTSAILLTRLVVPHMLQQQSGAIINMASTAGKHCPAFETVYGATKAGLIAFTQGLRGEYLDRGISTTAICPGFTRHGGMYDRMVAATGRRASMALGSTTASAVADAVIRAVRYGPPEIIVNWPPVRPAMVLRELFPRLGEMLVTAVSKKFVKRAVDARTDQAAKVAASDAHG